MALTECFSPKNSSPVPRTAGRQLALTVPYAGVCSRDRIPPDWDPRAPSNSSGGKTLSPSTKSFFGILAALSIATPNMYAEKQPQKCNQEWNPTYLPMPLCTEIKSYPFPGPLAFSTFLDFSRIFSAISRRPHQCVRLLVITPDNFKLYFSLK